MSISLPPQRKDQQLEDQQLEKLRGEILQGMHSGDATTLDMEAIKARGWARLDAQQAEVNQPNNALGALC